MSQELTFGCGARLEDGSLCAEGAACEVHTRRVPAPEGTYYKKSVWRLLDNMVQDATLDQVDGEIALLRSSIDNIDNDAELEAKDRYGLLIKAVREVVSVIAKRDQLLADREFLVHRSFLKWLLGQVYLVVCRYIKDDETRRRLGLDLEKINIAGYRASKEMHR